MAWIKQRVVFVYGFFISIFLFSTASGFNLTILHTNDIHARYNDTNKYGAQCTSDSCYAGAARIKTKADEIRSQYPNTLFLDGGDQYQGTLWFTHYGGIITYQMMNLLGYDAMALGNHEFDRNIDGLLPLLQNANFSILSCNIDTSPEPSVAPFIAKHYVASVGGERIGIIGYTTKDTPMISSPGSLIFLDEVTSIRAEVATLQSQGINKIIAVGHAGFPVDQRIAREVEGIDIVVGGHTNTFLYTGAPPSNEDPVGDYPYVVTQSNNERVLVVQDYAYGKYLGVLHVEFDSDGKIISYGGNPILLNSSVQKDSQMQSVIDTLGEAVLNSTTSVIGRTLVYLDGERMSCRVKECNMGNLIADGLVHHNLKDADSINGTRIFISLVNAGSIRASSDRGEITLGNAIEVQPFRNTLQTIQLQGRYLRAALELSVSEYTPSDPNGRFLQVSGIRVKYDIKKPVNSRVVEVKVLCSDCRIPEYVDLDNDKMYGMVLSDFVLGGGDSYTMIRDNAVQDHIVGDLDSDAFAEYIMSSSPVYIGVEGRIEFVDEATYLCSNNINSASRLSSTFIVLVSVFLYLYC